MRKTRDRVRAWKPHALTAVTKKLKSRVLILDHALQVISLSCVRPFWPSYSLDTSESSLIGNFMDPIPQVKTDTVVF